MNTSPELTLIEACVDRNLPQLKKLLSEGKIGVHDYNDYALRMACINGCFETVKYFVEKSADVHANNGSPLINACCEGSLEIVKYLVQNGANIHARNDEAFKEARNNNHKEILEYLNKQALVRKLQEL